MPSIVGIDLGTSTTCISVVENGKPKVIPSSRTSRVTPSYIYVKENGRVLVGENAKTEVISDPYNTIWATKRLMGHSFKDKKVQECREKLSYRIAAAENGSVLVLGRDKAFSPVNVASMILKYTTQQASARLGWPIEKAVITVPASFNDLKRKATKKAGEYIGLEVVRLVNEPTAAALAWGYLEDSEKTVAVYDLGGGTFDVSIMATGQGVYEVLATKGDSWLGGEDFDERLVDYIVEDFKKEYEINIYNDKMAHQRVKIAAENAKIELSSKDSARVHLESICPDLSRYADVDNTITKALFESMVEDLVDRTIDLFRQTLEDAQLDVDDLDNVILAGGMTRIPIVRQKIEELLGRTPDFTINPDEAVAMGAAIHAASLSGQTMSQPAPPPTKPPAKAKEANGDDIMDAMFDGVVVAGEAVKETPAPASNTQHEHGEWVDDDQAPPVPAEDARGETLPVHVGDSEKQTSEEPSASQEPAPASKIKAPLLIDVVSQSVGISDLAGIFVPLIPHNSKLPAKVSQVVTTAIDQQEAIRISVYQGEEKYVKDEVVLGEFVLQGIEKAPRGTPQIQVTFNIDQSGLFTVSARDLKTNVEKEIQVEGLEI